MSHFRVSRDSSGKPYHVYTDGGFAQCSRPYDEERDAWMLDVEEMREQQAAGARFAVKMAAGILDMDSEIAGLRREVARLRMVEKQYHELLSNSVHSAEQTAFGLLKVGLKMAELQANQKDPE